MLMSGRSKGLAAAAFCAATLAISFLAPVRGATGEAGEAGEAGEPRDADPEGSLLARLDEAVVQYGDHVCDEWTGNRWDCGLRGFEWVGRYRGRVSTARGPQWRACIFAHPRADGGRTVPLTIRFPKLDLTDGISGEVALLDVPRSGDPVEFLVKIGGRRGSRVRLTDGKNAPRRWTEWRADTEPGASEVTFQITARDPSWRHVCFTAAIEAAP